MQAVILAAGEGKRLRPLTNDHPKPMVLVGGKPILEYTLSILPNIIDEVILVVGYKQEKIKEYFGDAWQGRRLQYADQPEPKGTGDALVRARPFLNGEPFLMLFADDLYHPDDLATLVESEHPAILVKEHEQPERMGVCTVSDDGTLLELVEKPAFPLGNLVNVGPSFLHHDIFDLAIHEPLLANGESCLPEQIARLAKIRTVKAVRARFWHPIGYPEDLKSARTHLEKSLEDRTN